ncbi:hypothetical protein ACB092_12G203000 [Castanea dentata]
MEIKRSSDSRFEKFAKDDGIEPLRTLLERLSILSAFKFPIILGISPSNLLLERSMATKKSWILQYSPHAFVCQCH